MLPRSGGTFPGGRAQALIPSTTVGDWVDPNSVLASVAVTGDLVEMTLQNEAAGRDLPTTGAAYILPIRDLFGNNPTHMDNGALLCPHARWVATASIPPYCWFAIVPLVGSDLTARGAGSGAEGDATGIKPYVYYNVGGGWVALAGTAGFSAATRGMGGRRASSTDGSIVAYSGTVLFDANGGVVNARNDSTIRNLGAAPIDHTHVALCVGWTSASGTPGAVVSVRPYLIAANNVNVPGVS